VRKGVRRVSDLAVINVFGKSQLTAATNTTMRRIGK